MAQFNNNAITDLGKMLLAEIQMGGGIFDATRIVMGSGYMPAGQTIGTMTDVVTPVISLDINKREKTPDGKAVLGGYYSNKEVTAAFFWRELAVYARVAYQQADGSYIYGDEVLYSYGNAGSSADYMAAYSSNTAVEKQIDLVTWIGNETEIYLNIDGGVYVTVNQVVNMITQVENRINNTIYEFDNKSNQDLITIGDRLDDLERRVTGHDHEIAALKANDTQIQSRLNEVAARVDSVWDAILTEITENPAVVDFDTLDGFTLTGGVWNKPLRRLEV